MVDPEGLAGSQVTKVPPERVTVLAEPSRAWAWRKQSLQVT